MHTPGKHWIFRTVTVALALSIVSATASSGSLRERIAERRASQKNEVPQEEHEPTLSSKHLPANVRVVRDVPYGHHEKQRFDVYAPPEARGAPVIFLVHGGGWKRSDKTMRSVVENKLAHWVPQGYIVISTNYRMLPDTGPLDQAKDLRQALATAQNMAASWGGDRNRFVLMGHSAGAHLVGLLASAPQAALPGTSPWLGTILLDSAAMNVVEIMEDRHLRFYDDAFGSDPAYWKAASPFHALQRKIAPVLAVCSTRRADPCPQATRFVAKASQLGTRASVLRQDLSHREINLRLGENGPYTQAVDAFLQTLH